MLFEKKEELQKARLEAKETLKYHKIELASPAMVGQYIQSLRSLLEDSSIMLQKAFLRSFVERIEINDASNKTPTETIEVLPIVQDGSPFCIKCKTATNLGRRVFGEWSIYYLGIFLIYFNIFYETLYKRLPYMPSICQAK